MSHDDFDSDSGATGERRFNNSKSQSNYRSSSTSQKTSILKNSSMRRSTQYSDEEDENYTNNSGRLSNRNRYGNDSPLNSYRSDAGKPPSGRLQPIIAGKTNDYSNKKTLPALTYKNANDSDDAYADTRFTKKTGLNSINGINNNNENKYDKYDKLETTYDRYDNKKLETSSLSKYDRFDYKNESNYESANKSIDSKYDRFEKKSSPLDSNKYERFDIPLGPSKKGSKLYDSENKYDDNSTSITSPIKQNSLSKFDKFESKYDSKYDTKYDTYDEDEIINKKNDLSSKYFRSEGPLKSSTNTKLDPLDSLDLYSKGIVAKSQRSNSLDRIHSGYNQILASNTLTSTGKMSKFNSTSNLNGIDNSSDRSYTVTSMGSTTLSIKEAKSRSYLVGSLSALNGKGLLSSEELERHLVDKRARILVTTWNMGGTKKLSDNLDELLLPDMIQTMPDIYIIGSQEFELNQKEWEIALQEQIGPAHVKYTSYYYGSIGVCVFIKRELIWFCSVAEFEHINLRSGPINTPNATKASVLVSFQLFGTLMCFICSHFSSGEGNIEHRIENYKTTIHNIKLPNKLLTKNRLLATDGTDNFDCVFWFGDFNFRVDKERGKVVDKINDMRKKKSINYEEIMNHDELNRVIDEDKAFKNFLEGRITFEPTYKYELNSNEYDRSEKCRIPSYTDRILFRSRQKGIISCSFYDAVKEIKISDHRPVYGVYEVNIRPGVDTIPLSYGEFDRQVYAAGYQKRQMFRACDVGFNRKTAKNNKKSSPCSIQ